jgi:hypothetical protein
MGVCGLLTACSSRTLDVPESVAEQMKAKPPSGPLPTYALPSPPESQIISLENVQGRVFASVRTGLFEWDSRSESWRPFNDGLENVWVRTLAGTPDALYAVGNDHWVFRRGPKTIWERDEPQDAKPSSPLNMAEETLLASSGNAVVVARDRTIYCRNGAEREWRSALLDSKASELHGGRDGIFAFLEGPARDKTTLERINATKCEGENVKPVPAPIHTDFWAISGDEHMVAASEGGVFQWTGEDWQSIGPEGENRAAVSTGNYVAVGQRGHWYLRSSPHGRWVQMPGAWEQAVEVQGQLLVHAMSGLYLFDPQSLSYRPAARGLPPGQSTLWMQGDGLQIVVPHPAEMDSVGDRGDGSAVHWGNLPFCIRENGKTWQPLLNVSEGFEDIDPHAFAVSGDSLYASAEGRLVRSKLCGPWSEEPRAAHPETVDNYSLLGDELWRQGLEGLLRRTISPDGKPIWSKQEPPLELPSTGLSMAWFGQDPCVLQAQSWCLRKGEWKRLPPLGMNQGINGRPSRQHLLVFNAQQIQRISASFESWDLLTGLGLSGNIVDVWESDDDPNELLVYTMKSDTAKGGLFWSNDGGKVFTAVDNAHPGGHIARQGDGFVLATDEGLFYAVDQIPDRRYGLRLWNLVKEHPSETAWTVGLLFLFMVVSTRLLLVVLTWNIPPIPQTADIFFLTPLGRWRLFRGYRKRLANGLAEGAKHYVEIPFAVNGQPVAELVTKHVGEALGRGSVAVISDAGRGKSELAKAIAYRTATGELKFNGNRLEPVIVSGTNIDGDIVAAVATELRFNNVAVTDVIVRRQLEAGHMLIIVDGISEISPDKLGPLSASMRGLGDVRWMMTSRVELPAEIAPVMRAFETVKLLDVTGDAETAFFKLYTGSQKQAVALGNEIRQRFPALPRTPLLMKLIAKTYKETGQVPSTLANLFEVHIGDLMRRAKSSTADPVGLQFAVRKLTEETFLASSGAERGFPEDRGLTILGTLSDELKNRNTTASPLEILRRLQMAGIYAQPRNYVTATHDMLEDYFAAMVIDRELDDGKTENQDICRRTPQLQQVWDLLQEIRRDHPR